MTAALEGGEWSAARPGRTLPPGNTRYLLYRRLGGSQGQSGRAENLVPTGFRSRTVPPGGWVWIVKMWEQNLAVVCNDRSEGCLGQIFTSDRTQFTSDLQLWRRQPDPVPTILCFGGGGFGRFSQNWVMRQLSFVTSLCPSICPHGTTRLLLEGFPWNFVFEFFFSPKLSIGFKSH